MKNVQTFDMAVNVTVEPGAVVTALPALEWWLVQTAGPGANEELYLQYRINAGGNWLFSQSRPVKYTPHPAKLNFGRMVQARLTNDLKDLSDVTASLQAESVTDVYLQYAETTVDLITGSPTLSGPFATTTVKAIFGGFNPNQADPAADPAAPILLSNKPTRLKVARDQSDWLYVCGNSGANAYLQLFGYDASGSVVFSSAARQLGLGHYVGFPMGGANAYQQAGGIGNDVCYMELLVGEWPGVNLTTYRIDVYDCEDLPEAELYFREPTGGWGSIRFDNVLVNAVREVTSYSQYYYPGDTFANRLNAGGLAVSNSVGRNTYTLTKKLKQDSFKLADYYSGLFATKEHYIRRKNSAGAYYAERVFVSNGESGIARTGGTIEFSVTCQAAKAMNQI